MQTTKQGEMHESDTYMETESLVIGSTTEINDQTSNDEDGDQKHYMLRGAVSVGSEETILPPFRKEDTEHDFGRTHT